MDRYEEAVLQLLTANGETFVAPKYELDAGWMCPALVALRPARRQVLVVDVSASGYPLALVQRINQRLAQWYAPLLQQLQQRGVVDASWAVATVAVVREDQMDWMRTRIEDMGGVQLLSLELACSPWRWADAVWTGAWDCTAEPIPQRSGAATPQPMAAPSSQRH